MTRNEILEVVGKFYKPETITEREVAFARYMMNYEREACAKICDDLWEDDGTAYDCAEAIRTLGQT